MVNGGRLSLVNYALIISLSNYEFCGDYKSPVYNKQFLKFFVNDENLLFMKIFELIKTTSSKLMEC